MRDKVRSETHVTPLGASFLTAMTPFVLLVLTGEEAWQVLRYVRTFS